MSFSRPGVYVNEVLTPQSETVASASPSIGALVAPANRGPVEPTLIGSWVEFQRLYGGFSQTPDLAHAAYNFFANGGGGLVVGRIAGTGAAQATRTLNDRAATPVPTLTVKAKNAGAWGNSIAIQVSDASTGRFNLTVYFGGTTAADVVERWTDLSMNETDARYAVTVINHITAGSIYIAVTDENSATASPSNNPAVQSATVLATGADGTAPTATVKQNYFAVDGTSPLDIIEFPFNLNLPNETNTSVLNSVIAYADYRDGVFVVVDTAEGADVAAVATYVGGLTASSRAAVYYPRVHFLDPSSKNPNAVKLLPVGGAVLGKYAEVDGIDGPWKAPAGLSVDLRGAVQLERKLTSKDLDSLHGDHINAIRNITGLGIRIMGARTLKVRDADKYVSVRRTLSYIKDNLKRSTEFALFEGNDEDLWERLGAVASQFLGQLYSAGGLHGGSRDQAFYVKCDGELNTQAVIDSGEVRIEVGVALLQPAEFVVITVGQWQGGASATETQ